MRRMVPLRIRKPISPISGTTTALVEGRFEETSLPTQEFCRGEPSLAKPIIRAMNVKINTYACDFSVRRKCKRVSFVKGRCTLQQEYGFPEVPPGVPYDCSWRLPQPQQNDGLGEADGPNNDGWFDD